MTLRTKVIGLATYVVAMGFAATPARAATEPTCNAGWFGDPDPEGMCLDWVAFACSLVRPKCGYSNIEYSFCGAPEDPGTIYCDWSP